jgi:hypothetical protein
MKRLEEAFITLSDLSSAEFKLCFFVDGLDEYDGDPELLINLFTTISKSPYVKVCLSSRPWLIFEEAFESCPGLRLQDLTRDDIVQYVLDKLQTNARMERLKQSDPTGADLLVRAITDKANGVFLWVAIVTKSLIDGLRNHDSVSDLQRRLEKLPSDLDALYTCMINRIDPLYLDEASRMFKILDSAMDVGFQPSILEFDLALTTDYSSVRGSATKMTLGEIEDRCDRIVPQLKSRCEGLLEVHDIHDRHWEDRYLVSAGDEMASNDLGSYELGTAKPSSHDPCLENQLKINWKVAYLHRTVKDFLKTTPIRTKFERSSSLVAQFNPEFSLLLSFVINLKRSLRTLYFDVASPTERVNRALQTALKWVEAGDTQNHECPEAFVEFLDQAYKWGTDPAISPSRPPSSYAVWWAESISLAAWTGAWKCLQFLIENNEMSPDTTSLLLYALGLAWQQPSSLDENHHLIFPIESYQLNPEMVQMLLEHGANPYKLYDNVYIWESFLAEIENGSLGRDTDRELIKCSHILQAFLHYESQLTAGNSSICQGPFISYSLRSLIDDVFSKRLPKEASALRRACDLSRCRKR